MALCVDLSQLDYVYSDTINALIVMNKRVLDVFGRLSLLSPQPPVMEILKKSGVYNILKVFANEMEVLRVSEEVMNQAAQATATAPKGPVSEFEDLQAEIGSAFGEGFHAVTVSALTSMAAKLVLATPATAPPASTPCAV